MVIRTIRVFVEMCDVLPVGVISSPGQAGEWLPVRNLRTDVSTDPV